MLTSWLAHVGELLANAFQNCASKAQEPGLLFEEYPTGTLTPNFSIVLSLGWGSACGLGSRHAERLRITECILELSIMAAAEVQSGGHSMCHYD
jgi:hypothetical protein